MASGMGEQELGYLSSTAENEREREQYTAAVARPTFFKTLAEKRREEEGAATRRRDPTTRRDANNFDD